MNYKNKSFISKRKAFTLIELLIVIAIIGILFIVLVSKVDFATNKAKATGVQTDFRSFQVAIESVAKENAGLSTFGWDTGDVNGDRVRNSYDKGDTNKNGKQDPGEVFVGSKTYGETWTNIYTLTNPADANDKSAVAALEAAINANLDPKLHITIHDDYTITMANGAQDPWKTAYHGVYLTNAEVDGKDRGAIIIYSNGANQEFGSEHSIAGGIVTINVPGNNAYGKDDYSIISVYTYINGYGEVKTTTTGFSNNQGGGQAGTDGTFVPGNGGSGETPGNENLGVDVENVEIVFNTPLQFQTNYYDSDLKLLNESGYSTIAWEENKFGLEIYYYSPDQYYIQYAVYNSETDSWKYFCYFNESYGEWYSGAGWHEQTEDWNYIKCETPSIVLTENTNIERDSIDDLQPLFNHVHYYKTKNITSDYFMLKETECWSKYYYSCQCGKKGEDAFDQQTHTFQGTFCIVCQKQISGLYDKDDNLVASWDELCEQTFDLEKDYYCESYRGSGTPYNVLWPYGELAYKLVVDPSVTRIGEYAFDYVNHLKIVVLPDTITEIAYKAFYCCSGDQTLQQVNLPANLEVIGDYAFYHTDIKWNNLVIPDKVTKIGKYAFAQFFENSWFDPEYDVPTTNITGTLTIPDSVQTIGDFAFYFCGISNVELGANIHDVNGSIFAKCDYLTNISISENNPYYYEKQDCLISKSNGSIALGITTSTIPEDNTVTSIADKAFYYVTLKNMHIPGNIVSIGNDVFIGSHLETVTLSEGLVSIGDNAFVHVDKLIIPNSVTTIGAGALKADYIVLGTNVTTMGQGALPVQNSTIFILSDYVIDTPHWSSWWSTLQIYIRDDMYNKYINKFPYSSYYSLYPSQIKPLSEYQGEIPTN